MRIQRKCSVLTDCSANLVFASHLRLQRVDPCYFTEKNRQCIREEANETMCLHDVWPRRYSLARLQYAFHVHAASDCTVQSLHVYTAEGDITGKAPGGLGTHRSHSEHGQLLDRFFGVCWSQCQVS